MCSYLYLFMHIYTSGGGGGGDCPRGTRTRGDNPAGTGLVCVHLAYHRTHTTAAERRAEKRCIYLYMYIYIYSYLYLYFIFINPVAAEAAAREAQGREEAIRQVSLRR